MDKSMGKCISSDINKRMGIPASKYVENKQMNGLTAEYEVGFANIANVDANEWEKVMNRRGKLTK